VCPEQQRQPLDRGEAADVEQRPAGIGIGQWAVLLFLWARDGMSQAELSRVVAIEPPTMVRTIDRMARDELVTRVPDPDDGRLTRIYLTSVVDRCETSSSRRR
jgi:DNA-binding MarR family transcriptional regulator